MFLCLDKIGHMSNLWVIEEWGEIDILSFKRRGRVGLQKPYVDLKKLSLCSVVRFVSD